LSLAENSLTLHRIKEKLKSGEMVVNGDQWPIFLYAGYAYDHEDPWNGLFRSPVLISVRSLTFIASFTLITTVAGIQAHIYFTELSG